MSSATRCTFLISRYTLGGCPTKQRQEALNKLWLDDRHTLSPQRARNITRWLNQREALLRRWQKVLVPNLQTPVLTSLDKATDTWIDHDFVRSELANFFPDAAPLVTTMDSWTSTTSRAVSRRRLSNRSFGEPHIAWPE